MFKRFQMFNINTAHRNSGTLNNFMINLNHDNFRTINQNYKITISPITCVIPRTYYQVNEYNDNFIINVDDVDFVIQIKNGNYNVLSFLTEIQSKILIHDAKIEYDQIDNTYTFSTEDNLKVFKIIFTNYAHHMFGFEINDIIQFSFSSSKKSTKPINMNIEKSIKIHSNLPLINNSCVDNNNVINDFIQSTTLLNMPINVGPFENIIFQANNDENIIHTLSHGNIESINIWITDDLNRPLLIHNDWQILLKVTYISQLDRLELINSKILKIEEILRFMVLEKKSKKKQK